MVHCTMYTIDTWFFNSSIHHRSSSSSSSHRSSMQRKKKEKENISDHARQISFTGKEALHVRCSPWVWGNPHWCPAHDQETFLCCTVYPVSDRHWRIQAAAATIRLLSLDRHILIKPQALTTLKQYTEYSNVHCSVLINCHGSSILNGYRGHH